MAQLDTAQQPSGQALEVAGLISASGPSATFLTAGEAQVCTPSSAVVGSGQELQPFRVEQGTLQANTYSILSSSPRPISANSGSRNDVSNVSPGLAAESGKGSALEATYENVSGMPRTDEATKPLNQHYPIMSTSPKQIEMTPMPPTELYSIVSSTPQPVASLPGQPAEQYSIMSSFPRPVGSTPGPPAEQYSIVSSSPQPVALTPGPPTEHYSILSSSPQPVALTPGPPIELYSILSSSPQPVALTPGPPIEQYSILSSSPQPVALTPGPPTELYSILSSSPQPVALTPGHPIELYSILSSSPQPVALTPGPPTELYSILSSSLQPVALTPGPPTELYSIVSSSPQPVARTSEKRPSDLCSKSAMKAEATELSESSETTSNKLDSATHKNDSLSGEKTLTSDNLIKKKSTSDDTNENYDSKEESTTERSSAQLLVDDKESTEALPEKKQPKLERKVSRSASFGRALRRMSGKKEEEKIADGDGNTLDMTDKAHGTLYLKKKRLFSLWRRYFFVLDGSQLTYYSNREQYGRLTGCQGSVDLTLLHDVSQKKATFCFRTFYPLLLERRSRSALYLGAETVEEQQRWLELLQRALATRKAASRRVSQAKASSSSTSPDVVSSTLPTAMKKKKRSGSITKKLSFRRKSADKSHEVDRSSSEEELNSIREEKSILKNEKTTKNEDTDENKEADTVQPKKIIRVGIPGIVSEIGTVRLKKTSHGIETGAELPANLKNPEDTSGTSEGVFGVQLKKTNQKDKLMEDKNGTGTENTEGDSTDERGHDFRSLLRSRRISTTGVDTKLYVKYGGDTKSADKDKKKRSPSPNLPLSRTVKSVLDNSTENSDLVTKDYLDHAESSENKKAEFQEGSSVTDSSAVGTDLVDLTNGIQCAVQHAVAQNIRYSDPPNELKPLESQLNLASKSPSPNPEETSSKCDEEGWEMVKVCAEESVAVVPVEEERAMSSPEHSTMDKPQKISHISNIFINSVKHEMENTPTNINLAEKIDEAETRSKFGDSVDEEEMNSDILPVNFPSIVLEDDQGDSPNANICILDNESSISLSTVHTMRIIEEKRKTHSLDSLDDIVNHTYELLPDAPRASNSIEISEIENDTYEGDYVNIESIMTTFHSNKLVTTLKEVSESSEEEVVDSTVDEVVESDIEEILESYVDKTAETNSDDGLEPIDDEVPLLPDNAEEVNWMQGHADNECPVDNGDNFLRRDKPSRQASIPDERESEPVIFQLDTSQSSDTNSLSGDDCSTRPDYNTQQSIARSSTSVESGEPLLRTSFMGTRMSWGGSSNAGHTKGSNCDIDVSKESVSATSSELATINYTATDLQVPVMIRNVGSASTDTLTTLKETAPGKKLYQRKRPVSNPVSSNRDSLILPEFVVVEEDVHDYPEKKNTEKSKESV